ncbi:rod shape-determining protein MreC, partial [Motilimonas sp. 1_MG-2023]|uniref:rod shape-determining protein MreC n=1 Tax=Motilimonas sp. 1_MG-2023 TaxID=3062672 RepID=UPI0026E3638A
MLVTSVLCGRFPEGYPIAVIDRFDYDEGMPYARVDAKPVVSLDRIRYLLLLWPSESPDP